MVLCFRTFIKGRILEHLSSYENGQHSNLDSAIETTCDMLVELIALFPEDETFRSSYECLRTALYSVQEDSSSAMVSEEPQPSETRFSAGPGRPRLMVPDELDYLVQNNFKSTAIAKMYGVSTSTVKRWLKDFGLSTRILYSDMDNSELDDLVRKILDNHPGIGYRSVKAHLSTSGHQVQVERVRLSVRRVDPERNLFRHHVLQVAQRRTYNVRAPQALWHIDGYHKLIR